VVTWQAGHWEVGEGLGRWFVDPVEAECGTPRPGGECPQVDRLEPSRPPSLAEPSPHGRPANLLDHLHNCPYRGLWLIELDVVAALVGDQPLAVG
jgi:hypothetical protein